MGIPTRSCVCAALLVSARPVSAAPLPEVSLAWSGPEQCPSGDDVVARAERLLSKSDSPPAPLVARANVVSESGGLRLELDTWTGDRQYRRTIRAGSCGELADAAALILALLVDPGLRTDPSLASDSNRAEAPDVTAAQVIRSSSHGPRWGLRAGGVVDLGALPVAAAGVELAGVGQFGPFWLAAGATVFPAAGQVVAEATASQVRKGGTFRLFTGKLEACFRPFEHLDVGGCGAAELGFLRGEGFGTAVNDPHNVIWAAVGPGLEAGVPLTAALHLRGSAEGLIALQRPQFVLENVGFVYRPGPISARMALGLVLLFP